MDWFSNMDIFTKVGYGLALASSICLIIGQYRSTDRSERKNTAEHKVTQDQASEILDSTTGIARTTDGIDERTKGIDHKTDILIEQGKDTNKALDEQNFQNTFNTMQLRLNETVNSIVVIKEKKTFVMGKDEIGQPQRKNEVDQRIETKLSGLDSFDAYDNIILKQTPGGDVLNTYEEARLAYTYEYARINLQFESYHTTLATLFKYIEKSNLTKDRKTDYFSLVISSMSFNQKKALFYHIGLVADHTNPSEFNKVLVETEKKYKLLKNIGTNASGVQFDRELLYKTKVYAKK